MSNKRILVSAVCAVLGTGLWWGYAHEGWFAPENPATAWGSVDARHVRLAFEASGRVAQLTREEGERVSKGDFLGALDVRSLEIDRERVRAEAAAKAAAWRLAEAGYRTEEIDQARANERALARSLELARTNYARAERLYGVDALSRQEYDNALNQLRVIEAEHAGAMAERRQFEKGFRADEIAKARAEKDAAQAAVAALDYDIAVASRLVSPVDGVVRSRLAEPGDMVGSNKVVYELSITNPKWVRAFVTETQLRYVKEGARAIVMTDTTPPKEATVGFIASDAEFTPKPVQTQDLRSALVYEVRLNVDDPKNELRLGQPVTVDFAPEGSAR